MAHFKLLQVRMGCFFVLFYRKGVDCSGLEMLYVSLNCLCVVNWVGNGVGSRIFEL